MAYCFCQLPLFLFMNRQMLFRHVEISKPFCNLPENLHSLFLLPALVKYAGAGIQDPGTVRI